MLKELGFLGPILIAVILVLSGALLCLPDLTSDHIARLGAFSTLVMSASLIFVTAKYSSETTKIAKSSEEQVQALHAQLDLDLEPKLVGTIRRGSASTTGPAGRFVLINLSRHTMWVSAFEIRPPQVLESLGLATPRDDRDLQPGKLWDVYLHELSDHSATVTVRFFYGPTGNRLHTRSWQMVPDGDDLRAVELTNEA